VLRLLKRRDKKKTGEKGSKIYRSGRGKKREWGKRTRKESYLFPPTQRGEKEGGERKGQLNNLCSKTGKKGIQMQKSFKGEKNWLRGKRKGVRNLLLPLVTEKKKDYGGACLVLLQGEGRR